VDTHVPKLSTQPLKFALTGCGRIARDVHVPVIRRLSGVQLVAVADPHDESLESARHLAPGCAVFHSQDEMLDAVEADAVIIAAPSAVHAEMACQALGRRKHVYLEKPIATSLEEARQVVAAWRKAGVVAMPGFNYRFHPLVQELRRLLENDRIGALLAARTTFSIAACDPATWRASRASGGGALLDLATHHVDLIRFVFRREFAGVHASVRSIRSEGDCVAVQFHLQGGLVVQSIFSECGSEIDSFEVFGEYGSLAFDRYSSEQVEYAGPAHGAARLQRLLNRIKSFVPGPGWLEKVRAPLHEPSYEASLAHFVSAVRGEARLEYDLMDGYESIGVIAAAEESARVGGFIAFERGVPVDF
jgi:myo-inositol 2-dehydrogenase/D-chiro-inositol 1-dehydrogenase